LGVVNLIKWHQKEYKVNASSKSTMMAGIGFDACGWEIWPYLSAGASLFIIKENKSILLSELVDFYNTHGITHSFVATALVPELVIESGKRTTTLKYLLTGGDKLSPIITENFNYEIINNYGPTENTVVATSYILPKTDKYYLPLIGRPITNTCIYIIGKDGTLSPKGIAGEIYIGGIQLARGYLNRSDLTAEKFISNPFKKNERMYRTGDIGRWVEGNLEYMGRMDDQVKMRGYRIELGEIESVLLESGLVSQAVVMVRGETEDQRRLIGYIVMNESVIDQEQLQSYMQNRLPEYMIPLVLVELPSMPLTENGKINRKALPEPASITGYDYVAPRTETEHKLAEIWKNLLGIKRVGIHDNFFELGGHSLLAMKMNLHIKKAFQVNVSIKMIFQLRRMIDMCECVDVLSLTKVQESEMPVDVFEL
jgi:acyl-coenzyme A synthetase/AMP-(fatty) acid ligase